MKTIGISVYPDFYDNETLKIYLKKASDLGFKKVFVSLILGNLNFDDAKKASDESFKEIFLYCKELKLDVAADMNDKVFKELGCKIDDLSPLNEMGIPTLRLDGGFTSEEIAVMTKNNYGIKIEENASAITFEGEKWRKIVDERLDIISTQGNITNLIACHNFFPRPDTGLDFHEALMTTKHIQRYGVKVGAFVASQTAPSDLLKRGKGIPTIESHRSIPPHLAAQLMFAAGYDYILIGDSKASDQELEDLARIAKNDFLAIPIVFNKHVDQDTKKKLLDTLFESRLDQPAKLIRATQSRGIIVEPNNCVKRDKYAITIDNNLGSRYAGELQIMTSELDSVEYANVIGYIHPYGIELLEHIKYARNKFKLIEIDMEG